MTPTPPRPPFFVPDGDELVPEPIARGPWGATLRGRLLGGLTARYVEAHTADPELRCSRLTIDMFRPPAIAPVRVHGHIVRDGQRIRIVEVTIEQADGPVGQGRAVLLRRSEQPPGPFRGTPPWDAPTPLDGDDVLPLTESHRFTPTWDSWNISRTASMGEGLWIKEHHDLVRGEPLTPLVRAALIGDLSSPVTNASTGSLQFINADYTLYLGRDPRGEHLGVQPYGHISDEGIAVGMCTTHDLDGPFGFVATTAVANSVARANERSTTAS